MAEAPVIVIGGGIIGVCSALWLQRAGKEVVLVEADEIGMGSSFGNAGCLNVSSVVPVSMPGTLRKVPHYLMDPLGPLVIRPAYLPRIMPWLIRFLRAGTRTRVAAQAAALRPLLAGSYDSYQPLVQGTAAAELVHRQGHLIAYHTEADFAGDALAWQLRRDNGVDFEILRGEALREREPALARDIALGIWIPENGHTVNPLAFVTALADNFRAAGGKIERARVTGLELSGHRLAAVRTSSGILPAEKAVVACGARSKSLAAGLGDRIPLDTERGYHVVISNPEVMPRVPITDASGKFVATPMATGLRIAGTVEFAGLDAPPDYSRARQLVPQGKRLLPGLAGDYPEERLSLWMGCRPSIPDSLPVIGTARHCRDVVYAFGHGHVGLAGGSRTGMLVRDLLLDLPRSLPAAPFSPRRF